jgi:hypothetical protein
MKNFKQKNEICRKASIEVIEESKKAWRKREIKANRR